ncbi:MAG: PorT family protein [Saprospiraceae bacterium]|nr:PorT family protein [Saprospiraceae bacterium]
MQQPNPLPPPLSLPPPAPPPPGRGGAPPPPPPTPPPPPPRPPYFAFQPEIVYSTQGAKYKINSVDTKYNLDYINIPLLFQYMFDNGFRIQAGPQVGFLLSAKSKYNNSTIDNKNDLKPIDLSVSIGIGYIFPPSGFGIDARYNQGISNINKNDTGNSNNRGFQFGIFYIFNHN